MLKNSSSCYVYIYFNKEGRPYYVGHGTHGRAFAKHICPLIPVPPWKYIQIIECSSKVKAETLETKLIFKWKPVSDGGCLLNRAYGKSGTHIRNEKECINKVPQTDVYKYKFITADGTVYTPENVMSFINEHKLSYSAVRQVAIGNRISHKGWKVERY
jgi:hypothetical protein